MAMFNMMSDADAIDDAFVAAVSSIAGGAETRVCAGWMGCDRETWEPLDEPQSPAEIEWLRRRGRFGLDINVMGVALPAISTAAFVRALAMKIGRPLVFSDCSPNPWTWLMAEADGSIRHVWQSTETVDGEEVFDLDPGVAAWPIVIAAGAPLPPEEFADVGGLPSGCQTSGPARCVVFLTGRCPQPTQYGEVRS